ncbi:glycosyl transferase family 9 [Candidatus Protofrankia datiscae]|uniref:Glycosyl transferase family 9 n=1 Tax=Candidatus Protofrankia datiscae TaxID=2716812 RepID=F8B2S3_9ACTN|nr:MULTISPECIES: glycosyltransferase family 9 protein [Protofrankia]AEH07796.1 glycosyl transferase family 9 [Candidatus Protofrankia datiscae]
MTSRDSGRYRLSRYRPAGGRGPAGTVVALRALGLSDLLTVLPALRGLRRARPDARILLATPRWLEPVALLSGAVDGVVDTPKLGPVAVQRPALAVNLHGRGPASTQVLRATAPAELWAFDLAGGVSWDRDEHRAGNRQHAPREHHGDPRERQAGEEREVARWCRLLEAHGVACDPDDLSLPRPTVPPVVGGATIVHPGGAHPVRRWQARLWAQVARALATSSHRVVVTGGPEETELARTVAREAGLPPAAVLAGSIDLPELCALVAAGSLLLAANTGIGHLATAYGTPSVLLFGPVSPARWGPPPDRGQHVALWSGERGAADRNGSAAAGTEQGLASITPADVLRVVATLPGGHPPSPPPSP